MSKTIVCMNYQENPIPGCMYAVHQNGRVVASGQADGEGRATITETISSKSPTKIYFWPSERQIEAAYETDTFLWREERNLLGLRAPEEYTIPLRRTDNIAEEPANYMQKWHRVEQGDTLYSIANKYGTTVDALKTRNSLQTDTIAIGQQLLLPSTATRPTPNNTPTQPSTPQTESQTPSPTPSGPPQGDDDLGDFIDNLPEDGQTAGVPPTPSERPVPPVTPPTEQPQPTPSQQRPPPATNNGNMTIEQDRSAQTGRPESVASNPNECWCARDFTVAEIKQIVLLMRRMERIASEEIFSAWNSPLNQSDRTFERLTEELNKMFRNREINTCIRKIQFLAQCYHESDRFRTTLEYQDGSHLDIGAHRDARAMGHTVAGDGSRYKGRGIVQVTWRKTQYEYFENVMRNYPGYFGEKTIVQLFDRRGIYSEKMGRGRTFMCDSAALIAKDLFLACDASGWFWTQYKKYRRKNLNYFSDMGIYGFGTVTSLVHGGSSTITTRLPYYRRLRDDIFQFSTRCVNRDQLITDRSIVFGSTEYWNSIRSGEL